MKKKSVIIQDCQLSTLQSVQAFRCLPNYLEYVQKLLVDIYEPQVMIIINVQVE